MAIQETTQVTKTGIRRPFPFMNSIRSFVMDELVRRKNTYPTPISAPFVRMTSTKEDSEIGYKFFSLGLHGYESGIDNLFDLSYGRSGDIVGYGYSTTDVNSNGRLRKKLLYASDLTIRVPSDEETELMKYSPSAQSHLQEIQNKKSEEQKNIQSYGAQPVPGITKMDITRRGIGIPTQARVTWVCYNRQQLEFLRNHFMIIGSYVVLEWGHNFSDRQINLSLDFSDQNTILDTLALCVNGGRTSIIDTFVNANSGNYDLLVGTIGNYEIDFDAHHNIYTISTIIYSVGEQYWGISSHTTSIDPNQSPGSITTIYDFFAPDNSEFMLLCEDLTAKQNGYIADIKSKSIQEQAQRSEDLSSIGNNPEDFKFISWDYFATTIIQKMFEKIQNTEARELIKQFMQSIKIQSALGAGRKIKETKEQIPGIPYIGDSPELVSCRPETMILVKPNKPVTPALQSNGTFGNGKFGLLGDGVWLNAGAIRRAFALSNTFDAGLRNLLIEMNLATAGFWNLRLFFDEDDASLKIIDEKFGSIDNIPMLYKFNVGSKSELLSVNMESAFPPELTTQLALVASFQSKTSEERKALILKYPLIGTTSHFAFALNWTNLVDILQPKLGRTPITVNASNVNNDTDRLLAISTMNTPTTPIDQRARFSTLGQINPVQTESNRSVNTSIGEGPINNDQTSETGDNNEINKIQPTETVPGTPINMSTADSLMFRKSKVYERSINKWARYYNVDPLLIKSIIAVESAFEPSAIAKNPTLAKRWTDPNSKYFKTDYITGDENAYGLGQVLGDTARRNGYIPIINVQADVLGIIAPAGYYDSLISNPDEQVKLCVKVFKSFYDSSNNLGKTEIERTKNAISAYNGGWKPKQGLGSVWTGAADETDVCALWDFEKPNVCKERIPITINQYGNQLYVNKVWSYYTQKFPAQQNVAQPAQDATSQINPVTPTQLQQQQNKNRSTEASPQDDRLQEIINKYGTELAAMIEPNSSELMRRLIGEGLNRTPFPSNNFIAPFPTSAAVELNMLGIGGLSVSDSFLVDKLPFIYEEYGCFQITSIIEDISDSGWVTKVRGYFKLIWLDGKGITETNRKRVVF